MFGMLYIQQPGADLWFVTRAAHSAACLHYLSIPSHVCGLPVVHYHEACPELPCRLPMARQRLPPSTARPPTPSCPSTSPHLPSVLAQHLGQMGRPGSLEVRLSGSHAISVAQLKHHNKEHHKNSIHRAQCFRKHPADASHPHIQNDTWLTAQALGICTAVCMSA